tara:strand:+ start:102 stop:914 length:813 start_codon:yes stop_codon:yes gene_type:complete
MIEYEDVLYNLTDDEGNTLFKQIISSEEDVDLINKAVDILDKSPEMSGEEYINYKSLVERMCNESVINKNASKLFRDTNSAGFKIPEFSFNTPDKAHKLFRYNNVDRLKHLLQDEHDDGSVTHSKISADDLYTKILESLIDAKSDDLSWAHTIGSQMILIRDYWGECVSHGAKGALKPIDFANELTAIINTVGQYLYQKNGNAVKSYGFDRGYQLAKEQTTHVHVKSFILKFKKAYPNCDYPVLDDIIKSIDKQIKDELDEIELSSNKNT